MQPFLISTLFPLPLSLAPPKHPLVNPSSVQLVHHAATHSLRKKSHGWFNPFWGSFPTCHSKEITSLTHFPTIASESPSSPPETVRSKSTSFFGKATSRESVPKSMRAKPTQSDGANTKENGGGEKCRRNEVIREYEGEWRRGKMPPKRSNTRIRRRMAEGKMPPKRSNTRIMPTVVEQSHARTFFYCNPTPKEITRVSEQTFPRVLLPYFALEKKLCLCNVFL